MPQPQTPPDCFMCSHKNGPWCQASKRGLAYAVDERSYGSRIARLLGHCGAAGRLFERRPLKTDEQLLENLVRIARKGRGYQMRWVHVMHVFAVGSTLARTLCARFGYDPDEKVR